MKEKNLIEPKGEVGFGTLPDQVVDNCVSKGFHFNLMLIGETGIGKSTLVDTLFNTNFDWIPSSHEEGKVSLHSYEYDLIEGDVRLKMRIDESVGFGDQIDKSNDIRLIEEYIENQYRSYLKEELKICRSLLTMKDKRIHCCLYFIPPTGHSLKQMDILTLKSLSNKVNVIPIIAKADTVTKSELNRFKSKVLDDIQKNQIDIYGLSMEKENHLNDILPFAVIASNERVQLNGKLVRARHYPWGIVQIDNEGHSDFIKLRELLLKENMSDLICSTHLKHYRKYREFTLINLQSSINNNNNNEKYIDELFEKRQQFIDEEFTKKQNEIKDNFVKRVYAKEIELKEKEKKINEEYEKRRTEFGNKQQELTSKETQLNKDISQLREKVTTVTKGHSSNLSLSKNKKK
ncbi:hypothetical protein SNEBB_005707 [Seison nebaliae]|nr:hypothetical protein SNEBB_005707 [Seison nebaliae]